MFLKELEKVLKFLGLVVVLFFVAFTDNNLQAISGEGKITYTGGINGTANIDPFTGSNGSSISGSKSATNLDANDESKVSFSFPAGDYKEEYDVVLVVDGTNSFVPLAENTQSFLNAMATELASRTNVKLNVGVVSYGTVSYSSFSAPSGMVGNMFNTCVKSGFTGGLCSMAISQVPAQYQPMISNLVANPNYPGNMAAPHSESFRYLLGSNNSLMQLTSATSPSDVTSASALYNTLMTNGSDYAMTSMMTYCAITNCSMLTTLGYSMSNPVVGTNLEASIKAGREMLSNGNAPAENKFLVLVTDGGSYYWDSSKAISTSAQQSLSQGFNPRNPSWGNANFDWTRANASFRNYSDFKSFMNNSGILNDNTSQMSIADYQAWKVNPTSVDLSYLASSTNDYPYMSLEKGLAHAGAQLQEYVNNQNGRLITLASLYNYNDYPPYTAPGGNIYELNAMFRNYTQDISNSYHFINNATQSQDVADSFDSIVNQLMYLIDHGRLTDVIGKSFNLVMSGNTLNANDIKITLDGATVTGVIDSSNPNKINFGTADSSGVYPYVVTYVPGADEKIILDINVPIETAKKVTLDYTIKLVRDKKAGWNEAKLNEQATIDFVGSNKANGSAAFPIPMTKYYVPYHYKVSYNGNGGTGILLDDKSPYLEKTKVIVADPHNKIVRAGYNFIEWNTKADGSGETYQPGDTFTINSNLTLFAMWKQKAKHDQKINPIIPDTGNDVTAGLILLVIAGIGMLAREVHLKRNNKV